MFREQPGIRLVGLNALKIEEAKIMVSSRENSISISISNPYFLFSKN